MRLRLRFLLAPLLAVLAAVSLSAAPLPDDGAVRALLVRAMLSKGPDQLKLLTELSNSGSRFARESLNAWTHDEVLLYTAPDGAKVPVILEEQQDAQGKAPALRIDTGHRLVDPQGP